MVQVLFRNQDIVKEMATALKKHFRKGGGEASQHECLHLCARMFGFENYKHLLNNLTDDPSPTDSAASPSEIAERAKQYHREIMRMGFSDQQAWDLLVDFKKGAWFGFDRFADVVPALQVDEVKVE